MVERRSNTPHDKAETLELYFGVDIVNFGISKEDIKKSMCENVMMYCKIYVVYNNV